MGLGGGSGILHQAVAGALPVTRDGGAFGYVAAEGRLQLAGLRIFGLGDTGATEHHARKGHRPRACEVTGRQRDIFDRLGYGLSATSSPPGNLGCLRLVRARYVAVSQ